MMVILSPALSERRVQPARPRMPGLLVSTPQLTTLPEPSLHVQIDLGVRVDPDEFGDRALDWDAGRFIVGRVSMMGEQGAGGKQERKQREQVWQASSFVLY